MQIVHRDISPSNIFISKRGDVKLGDFGIAHAQRRESKTQAGTLKGKYGYMSPEQVVGKPIDARSDLFAVGVVLAELLTGRRLFSAPADLDVLLKVRDVKLDRLDKYGADLPKALDRIVRRALRKDPRERFSERGGVARRARPTTCSRPDSASGPSDLRAFTGTLFDTSPDAAARLLQEARRLETRARSRQAPRRRPARSAGRRPAAAAPAAPRRRPRPRRFRRRRRWSPTSCRTRPPRRPRASAEPGELARGREQRPLVGARLHAGLAARRDARRRCAPVRSRLAGRPATHSDVGQVRLGGAQAAARQRGRRQRHHADAAVAAIWRWPARPACCTSSSATQRKEIFLVGGAPESVSSSNPASASASTWSASRCWGQATWSWRSACCPTTTASSATRWWRWACCARWTCSGCCPSRCAIASSTCSRGPKGRSRYYRGVTNRQDNFPLGLDHVRDPGRQRGQSAHDRCSSSGSTRCSTTDPSRRGASALEPEAFRIGPTPREVLNLLDGYRTLRDWMDAVRRPRRAADVPALALPAVETDLAELD